MEGRRECGCKGIRTCLLCEDHTPSSLEDTNDACQIYCYCNVCNKARQETYYSPHPHPNMDVKVMEFPGILIVKDFVTEEEEHLLCSEIDKTPFAKSQSGRCKQDYGPKVNFKKQKVKTEVFTGLPSFSKFVYDRMLTVPNLTDFVPVELCNLEYTPERGSAIDPHFDDFWLWGERLVTLNLVSDTTLCFTKDDLQGVEVHVPLFRRSLIVVHGEARNDWKHAIHRYDVKERRLAMTFRELSQEFMSGGKREDVGQKLIDVALTFNGIAVGTQPSMSAEL